MAQAMDQKRRVQAVSLQEMAQTLVRILGRPPIAYVCGVRSLKTITRWTTGEVTRIRDIEVERKLINMWQVVKYLLDEGEGDDTIRMWMFGMNPALNDDSPLMELAEGDPKNAMGAAVNLVWGLFG